jgi:hypothetical protein
MFQLALSLFRLRFHRKKAVATIKKSVVDLFVNE